MRVLLVRPSSGKSYKTLGPDLGLGLLATSLRREGIETRVFDFMKPGASLAAFYRTLGSGGFDVVGIKVYSRDVPFARQLLREAGRLGRGRPITVVGGPFATGMSEDLFNAVPEADFGFAGEAEEDFPAFLRSLDGTGSDREGIRGLIWRDGSRVRANEQRFVADLDASGFPDYRDMDPREYPPDYTGDVYVTVMATRGCPYRCTYCAGPVLSGRVLRKRAATRFVAEIEWLKREHGVACVSIVDDNFTLDPRYAQQILDLLPERCPWLRWRAPNGVRLDSLDEELLRAIERSGCVELYLGIESGSPRILKTMNRAVDLGTLEERVRLVRRHTSANLLGFFILGYPDEGLADLWATLRFALRLPLDRAGFFFFTPHPGSEIFERLKGEGRIARTIWDACFYERISVPPPGVGRARLYLVQKLALLVFYLRPRILLRMFAGVRSPRQLFRLVERALSVALNG